MTIAGLHHGWARGGEEVERGISNRKWRFERSFKQEMEVYIEVGGISKRSCSINGIKCLLNGRLKQKFKILEGCRNRSVVVGR